MNTQIPVPKKYTKLSGYPNSALLQETDFESLTATGTKLWLFNTKYFLLLLIKHATILMYLNLNSRVSM